MHALCGAHFQWTRSLLSFRLRWSVRLASDFLVTSQAYCSNPLCDLHLFLDIHAHSTVMNGFLFANVPEVPRHCAPSLARCNPRPRPAPCANAKPVRRACSGPA